MCDSISERVAKLLHTHAPPRFRSNLQYRRVLSQSLLHIQKVLKIVTYKLYQVK